jgi:hypothetical protein
MTAISNKGEQKGEQKRELTFRVWDTVGKQMSPEFSLFGEFTLIGGVHAWQHESGVPGDSLERLADLIEMQYCDEKYSDGTKVCEGDIYEYAYEYDSDYDGDIPIVKKTSGKGHVKSIYDVWQIKTAKSEGGTVKCIGNIYEHPELLHP